MHTMSARHLPVADSGPKGPHAHLGHMLFDTFTLAFCCFESLQSDSTARNTCIHFQDNIQTVNALQL